MKKLLMLVLLLGGVVAASIAGLNQYYVAHWERPSAEPDVIVQIPSGSSATAVYWKMVEHHRLPGTKLFYYWFRLHGFSGIKSGEYRWAQGQSPDQLWNDMRNERVILYPLTIIEGWNSYQILSYLASLDGLDYDIVSTTPQALARELGMAESSVEGYIAPDTYYYRRGDSARAVLEHSVESMRGWLKEAWSARRDGLPLGSATELLTLASIVEKETGIASERATIASVFVNRLNKKMRLQTDPTVIYGLEPNFNGDITRRDLRTKTPWNTYVIRGLPPTPIASPSRDALFASASPTDEEYLYFVATGDGGHTFSYTLKEHNAAVRRYLARAKK